MTAKDKGKETFELIAKTVYGLEEVLAGELDKIGAKKIEIHNRAVVFEADKRLMYSANLLLRTASKILKPIRKFMAADTGKLYKEVQEIDWREYLDARDTLAVESVVSSPYFNHSNYVSLKVKDAIVDQFRKRYGIRPSVDAENPMLGINVHIFNDNCTLSLDSSGQSLHKRGYRLDKDKAPISEVLAAGLVLLSGWDRKSDFIDPMCGSGTILIEAAMYAHNIAPGINRRDFGFRRWKDFEYGLWNNIRKDAERNVTGFKHKIFGSDISKTAVEITKKNIERAGLGGEITLSVKPFEKFLPASSDGFLIMNPPYGERMEKEDIGSFYKMIGDGLKQHFTGYAAWILSSNRDALNHIRLKPAKKIILYNGPLECRFQKYDLYEGSKRPDKTVEQTGNSDLYGNILDNDIK